MTAASSRVVDVLFVAPPLQCSSPTLYTLNLATGLRARGCRVKVLTTGGPFEDVFADRGIPLEIHPLLEKPFVEWFILQGVSRTLRDERWQVVHAASWRKGKRAHALGRRLDLPVVVTVHRYASPDQPELDPGALGGVIALSEDLRANIVNVRRVPRELVRLIAPGIAELEGPPPEPPFSRPGGAPIVGTIAELDKLDAIEDFLRAARAVLDRDDRVQFLVVGETERERFRGLVRELGIGKNVISAPSPSGALRLLPAFDISVLPSLREGPGQCLLEALACGRPVIAIGEGGAFHVVRDEETGLLVEKRDPALIAAAILRLIAAPERARDMGRRAREVALERFPLERTVDETLAFYEQVCAQASAR